jgi:purine-nucleoside phosphorylase
METAALYTIAAKFRAKALGIFTISDNLITKEFASAEDRQNAYNDMALLALNTL